MLNYACLESGPLFLKHDKRIWLRDVTARKQSLMYVPGTAKSVKFHIIGTELKKPQEFPPTLSSLGQIHWPLQAKEQRVSAKSSWSQYSSKRKRSLEDSRVYFCLYHTTTVWLGQINGVPVLLTNQWSLSIKLGTKIFLNPYFWLGLLVLYFSIGLEQISSMQGRLLKGWLSSTFVSLDKKLPVPCYMLLFLWIAIRI